MTPSFESSRDTSSKGGGNSTSTGRELAKERGVSVLSSASAGKRKGEQGRERREAAEIRFASTVAHHLPRPSCSRTWYCLGVCLPDQGCPDRALFSVVARASRDGHDPGALHLRRDSPAHRFALSSSPPRRALYPCTSGAPDLPNQDPTASGRTISRTACATKGRAAGKGAW